MAKQRKKRYTRNDKFLYVLSILIVFSLLLATGAALFAPEGSGIGTGF